MPAVAQEFEGEVVIVNYIYDDTKTNHNLSINFLDRKIDRLSNAAGVVYFDLYPNSSSIYSVYDAKKFSERELYRVHKAWSEICQDIEVGADSSCLTLVRERAYINKFTDDFNIIGNGIRISKELNELLIMKDNLNDIYCDSKCEDFIHSMKWNRNGTIRTKGLFKIDILSFSERK